MNATKPDFESLLHGPPRPDLLSALAGRLRTIADGRETGATRAEVEAALACRWWGLRVLAIRALGRWGGRQNRAWLTERARRPLMSYGVLSRLPRGAPERWPADETVACREAVAPHLDEGDAGWILDLWFADFHTFAGLHAALHRLPSPVVCERLHAELAGPDATRREAVLWLILNRRSLDCRERLFRRMAEDADPKLAALSRRIAAIAAHREGKEIRAPG